MAYDSDRRLNYLDDEVTSRLGAINATGRGTISIADGSSSATATITTVVTARTMVRHMGAVSNDTTVSQTMTRIELTNATTITAAVQGAGSGGRVLTVGYEYTEFAA